MRAKTLSIKYFVKDINTNYFSETTEKLLAGEYVQTRFKEHPVFRGYFCGEDGRIYHITPTGKVVQLSNQALNEDGGYPIAGFYKIGQRKPYSMLQHRFIYQAFFGEIPEGYDVHHKDHDHFNNRPDNLELLTIHKNRAHGLCKGKKYMTKKRMAAIQAKLDENNL